IVPSRALRSTITGTTGHGCIFCIRDPGSTVSLRLESACDLLSLSQGWKGTHTHTAQLNLVDGGRGDVDGITGLVEAVAQCAGFFCAWYGRNLYGITGRTPAVRIGY